MPSCFVYGCNTGNHGETNTHMFTSPKGSKPEIVKQWIRNLPRSDKTFDPLNRLHQVCVNHFDPSFVIKSDTLIIDNKTIEIPRIRWKLTEDAVPTIFKSAPSYYSKKLPTKRKPVLDRVDRPPSKRQRKTVACSSVAGTEPISINDNVVPEPATFNIHMVKTFGTSLHSEWEFKLLSENGDESCYFLQLKSLSDLALVHKQIRVISSN